MRISTIRAAYPPARSRATQALAVAGREKTPNWAQRPAAALRIWTRICRAKPPGNTAATVRVAIAFSGSVTLSTNSELPPQPGNDASGMRRERTRRSTAGR